MYMCQKVLYQRMDLPIDNKKDLEDIPDTVKNKLNFVYVEHADEVFPVALEKKL